MADNRRSFIRKFGITLGSLIASGALPGCGARKTGASSDTQSQAGKPKDGGLSKAQSQAGKPKDGGLSKAQSQAGKPKEPAAKPRAPEWEQLRQCWLNLSNLENLQNDWSKNREAPKPDGDAISAAIDKLAKEHQAILATLVARGQLQKPVTEHMQMAFDEAVSYVRPSQGVCYYPRMIGAPQGDLLQQVEALRKISGDLDPATVAQAEAAITQDIAFFEIFRARAASDQRLDDVYDDYSAGRIKADPEELQAARWLTELLLERPN
jgi:hypothetical protein